SLPSPDGDPRAAAALAAPLQSVMYDDDRDHRAFLVHSTKVSGLPMAAAMDHVIESADGIGTASESYPELARVRVIADLAPGRPLRIVKFLAYGWSRERSTPALRDQVGAALSGARHRGWDGLLTEQRAYLDDFWDRADVELDGDPELQQA